MAVSFKQRQLTLCCSHLCADTQHYCSYRPQNQGCIAAGWLDQAHRLTFSWVSCLQVSSLSVWRRPCSCVWLSLVFLSWDSAHAWLVNTKRELLLKIVLSGWRGGCFSCEMPEVLLCLLSPSSRSDCVVLAPSRGVWCTQVQHAGALLSRQALQRDHHAMVTGCITRIANHAKLSTFCEIHGWKERGCGSSHLPVPPGAAWAFFQGWLSVGCWQRGPGTAASGTGLWWNRTPGWLPERGSGGWAEPLWGLVVVTFPNVLSFNTAESQEQRPSGKTNTIMQNKRGSQSKHRPPPPFLAKKITAVGVYPVWELEDWVCCSVSWLLGFCVATFI